MTKNFDYYDIEFHKHEFENKICVTGSIKNNTENNYSVALFRIILFHASLVLGNGLIKISGLGTLRAKAFEAVLDVPDAMMSRITHWDIEFEGGY